MSIIKTLISIAAVTLLLTSSAVAAKERVDVSQDKLIAMQKAKASDSFLLLDVRSAEEFAAGHIKGAMNISHQDVAANLSKIIGYKDKPVIVYCRSGRRAGIAEELLIANGFTKVKHLAGDMNGWQTENLPVEK